MFPGCTLSIVDGDTSQPSPYSTTETKKERREEGRERKEAERKVEWRGGKKRRRRAEKEGRNYMKKH